jgi:VWFA-related protein
VTDRKGNPIRGLATEEFELLVDNELVPLAAVEEFCGPPQVADDGDESISSPGGQALADGAIGEGTSDGAAGGDPGARIRHYILFFDMSHLKAGSRSKAIRIATEFVGERMGPADRAMILAFSRGLHLVSGFTGDRDVLLARLARMEEDRALLDTAPFEQEVTLERFGNEARRDSRSISRSASSLGRGMPASLANPECLAEARIAEIETTRAIRTIANTMPAFSDLPGRKALMLFTETLQADPADAYFSACGIRHQERPSLGLTVAPEISDLAHRANLAGVSFYPMHAGGMSAGLTGRVMEQSVSFQKSISLSTGGESFIVMRNPLVAFEQAERDLSCYYMLAYRVEEGMRPGRHSVAVRVSRRKARVRHRESFELQTADEASEQQMLAVLSNPGLYRELSVGARGYTLADAGKGARHFLIQASVPRSELVLLPSGPAERTGRIHLRGGVISERGELACEFSGTHAFRSGGASPDEKAGAGVQAVCDLEEGDYELVVAGRDENGGALGTFWGRFPVRTDGAWSPSGALLWAPAPDGSWSRLAESPWLPSVGGAGTPLFVRHSLDLGRDEPGVLTFTACRTTGRADTAAAALEAAAVTLRGRSTVRLDAAPVKERPRGLCELLRARIDPGSLPPDDYEIIPSVGDPWAPTGSPMRLRIR